MSTFKRLIPLFDRVLVRRVVPQTKTASGIILPESQSKVNEGVVVAVGNGRPSHGKEGGYEMTVKEGDRVLLPEYGGNVIKLDNEDFTLFREADILGVLKDK